MKRMKKASYLLKHMAVVRRGEKSRFTRVKKLPTRHRAISVAWRGRWLILSRRDSRRNPQQRRTVRRFSQSQINSDATRYLWPRCIRSCQVLVTCNDTPRMYIADIVLLYFITRTGRGTPVVAYPGAGKPVTGTCGSLSLPSLSLSLSLSLCHGAHTLEHSLLHAGYPVLPVVPFRNIILRVSLWFKLSLDAS